MTQAATEAAAANAARQQTEQVAEFQASMLSGIKADQMGRSGRDPAGSVRAGLERTWVEGEGGKMRKRTPEEIDAALAS